MICLLSTQAWGARFYVDASKANDFGNGLSWSTAKKNLYEVLPLLNEEDEVWVKYGVYKPASSSSSFNVIASNIAIHGGFIGTENSITERPPVDPISIKTNPVNQRSVLSGYFGGGNNDCTNIITSGYGSNYSMLIDGFEISHAKDDAIFHLSGNSDHGMHYQNLYFTDVAGAIHVQGNGHFIKHILCESMRPTTQWIFDSSYGRSTWEDITINGDGTTPMFNALTVDGYGSFVNVNGFYVNNVKLADSAALIAIGLDESAFITDLVINTVLVNNPTSGFIIYSMSSLINLSRSIITNVNIIGTPSPYIYIDSTSGFLFDSMVNSKLNISDTEFSNFTGMSGNAFDLLFFLP